MRVRDGGQVSRREQAMFRRSARVVFVLAICLALTGASCFKSEGPTVAKAFVRSGDDAFRAAPEVLEDLAPQMRAQLQDVRLASGNAPSRALEVRGITIASGVDGVSAAAVTESSTPLARLNTLVEEYGTDAYGWACEVIGAIDTMNESGGLPTPDAVRNQLGWGSGSMALYTEIYNIVYGAGDNSDAHNASQWVIWGACLPANAPGL
jgi:hypothetical protein